MGYMPAYSAPTARRCSVIRSSEARRIDVPKNFLNSGSRSNNFWCPTRYTEVGQVQKRKPKGSRVLASGGLPGRPWQRPGPSRQTANCNTHTLGETPR